MIELLAKLTAKTPSLNPIGGKPETTWEDVAGSLPHLCRHGTLYLYAKYIDIGLDPQLHAEAKAVALAKYGNKDAVRVKALASIALDQALNTGHCQHCQGSGQIANREGFEQCSHCNGTGRAKELSQRQLMSALHVGVNNVKNLWRPRLNELLADYQGYDMAAEESLRRLKKNN